MDTRLNKIAGGIKKHFGAVDNVPDRLKYYSDINNTYESWGWLPVLQNSIEISSQSFGMLFWNKSRMPKRKRDHPQNQRAITALKPSENPWRGPAKPMTALPWLTRWSTLSRKEIMPRKHSVRVNSGWPRSRITRMPSWWWIQRQDFLWNVAAERFSLFQFRAIGKLLHDFIVPQRSQAPPSAFRNYWNHAVTFQ